LTDVAVFRSPFYDGSGNPDVTDPAISRRLKPATSHRRPKNAISKWAEAHLSPQTTAISDGLGCFAAVANGCCRHVPVVVGAPLARDLPQFKWVNTVLGNLKTNLAGAFPSLKYSKYDDHLPGRLQLPLQSPIRFA